MNEIEEKLYQKAMNYKQSIAMYKKLYENRPIEKFADIPLLNKRILVEDQRNYPPFGSNSLVDSSKLSRVHRTSGTSDSPLMLTLTHEDVKNVIKTGKKAFELAGLTPQDVVVNCMNYCMWMGGFMDHQSLEATGATVIPYGVGHTENLIEILRSIPNVCIHATPSYLAVLEKVAREKFGIGPSEIGISKGYFGGEGGFEDRNYRKKLEEKWNMEIHNANYGMSEVMSIVASEREGNTDGLYFVAQDILYPELYIKEEGIASNSFIRQGMVGELVLSNCCKESQPLLRYTTGDIIEVLEAKQENIIQDFKFRVVGRSDDMLVVKGINFYPGVIRNIISKYAVCTGNYQIQILNTHVIDRLKLVIETNVIDNEQIMRNMKERIEKEIKAKYFVSCEVEFKEQLENESNKLKLVKKVTDFE